MTAIATPSTDTTLQKGTPVVSSDKKETGSMTGTTRRCQLEGCNGLRMGVKWADRKLSWPCTKGMVYKNGKWEIR